MTARDTLHEAKFDEVKALRRRIKDLEAENEKLRRRLDVAPKPGPAPHPGQMKIEGI